MKKYVLWMNAAILIISCIINLTACSPDNGNKLPDDDVPCIGIAWRSDTESGFYTNAVKAIEEAGGKAVMLNQVCPKGFNMTGKVLFWLNIPMKTASYFNLTLTS